MNKKIHRPIYAGIVEALNQIFNNNFYADKVIERAFQQNKKWGSRDRKLVAEVVYDIVRWWRRLTYSLDWPELKTYAPDQLEQVVNLWLMIKGYPSFQNIPKNVLQKWHHPPTPDIEQSFPKWLAELFQTEKPDSALKLMEALNQPAPLFLRVNTLKVSPERLKEHLEKNNLVIQSVAGRPETMIELSERTNVFKLDEYRQGWFEVQDGGSQLIAPFLQPEPGQRVVDACAGAGGKTLHLAALMENRGKIIAMDIHSNRLKELKKRVARAGVDIVEIRWIENQKVIKRLESSADRVLLDVPCTGLGVLRRNPDRKWKMKPEELRQLQELQEKILGGYSRMVKPGGKLVYATCSVLPSENETQVEKFLSQNKTQWKLEEEMQINPIDSGYDGFYAARLTRLS